MSQQIKVSVWPLWNQKLNIRHNGEVHIIFMDFNPKLDLMWYFVKDHFPSNDNKIRNVDKTINLLLKSWMLFCIKCRNCSVLQTGSNLDFLPPCHTQGHCLSLILSFPTHKSRLLSSRERIYQTDWPALSRLQVLGWTFFGSDQHIFQLNLAAAY